MNGRYGTAGRFLLLCAVWGTAFMATDVGLPISCSAVRGRALRRRCRAAVRRRFRLRRGRPPRTRDDYVYVLVGGALIIGAHHAFLFAGQRYVTGGVAAVLLGLVPVVTPALTRLVSTDEDSPSPPRSASCSGSLASSSSPTRPTNIADSVLGVSLVLCVCARVRHRRGRRAQSIAVDAVPLHAGVDDGHRCRRPPRRRARAPRPVIRGRHVDAVRARRTRVPLRGRRRRRFLLSTSRCWTISAPSR